MSSDSHFIVYSKPECPFCEKAIDLLNENKKVFHVIDLSIDKRSMSYIKGRGFTTVPQIFTASVESGSFERAAHIGGHAELVKYFKKK